MPDGYGDGLPSWALTALQSRADHPRDLRQLIDNCIHEIGKLNKKLELRDKKIRSLEGKVERIQKKLD